MAKNIEELESLLNQLTTDKNNLDKKIKLVTVSTIKPSSRNTVYISVFDNLSALLSATHESLDYLNNNRQTLDRRAIDIGQNYISGIMDEFEGYVEILQKISADPHIFLQDQKQIYEQILELNQKFIDIDTKSEVNILSHEEKRLFKILKGQLDYLEKLFKDPQNFEKENIKKTLKKAESMAIVLSSPMGIFNSIPTDPTNPNSRDFIGLYNFISVNNTNLINHLKRLEAQYFPSTKKQPSNTASQTTEMKIQSTLEKHERALNSIESKARMLNNVVGSAQSYISVVDDRKETIQTLERMLENTLNKTTAEITNFDFRTMNRDLIEILDKAMNDLNSEAVQQVRQCVDTMINADVDYFNHSVYLANLNDPSIRDTLITMLKNAYQEIAVKADLVEAKINATKINHEKTQEIETKAIVAIVEIQNDLNEIWRQKSKPNPEQHQSLIDKHIANIVQLQNALLQNKDLFLQSPGGKEKLDNFTKQLNALALTIIKTIPDPKSQQKYQSKYDSIVQKRGISNQSLPNWASIKPDVTSVEAKQMARQNTDPNKYR